MTDAAPQRNRNMSGLRAGNGRQDLPNRHRPVAPSVGPALRKIFELQAAAGLTDRLLAQKVGYVQSNYPMIRAGRSVMSMRVLEDHANFFGLTIVLADPNPAVFHEELGGMVEGPALYEGQQLWVKYP